jgi:hypothetical protein
MEPLASGSGLNAGFAAWEGRHRGATGVSSRRRLRHSSFASSRARTAALSRDGCARLARTASPWIQIRDHGGPLRSPSSRDVKSSGCQRVSSRRRLRRSTSASSLARTAALSRRRLYRSPRAPPPWIQIRDPAGPIGSPADWLRNGNGGLVATFRRTAECRLEPKLRLPSSWRA